MAGVKRRLSLVGLMAVTTQLHAADFPVLGLDEQLKMDRVLLQYLMANQKTGCAAGGDFDCYVAVQGRAPSQQYLNTIGAPPGRLRPADESEAARANLKKNHIGSGHNVMQLNIGGFSLIGPQTAHATVRELCGPVMCGSISTATMKKTKNGWAVQSFTVDVMQ